MDIQHIAKLANLLIDTDEQDLFATQITAILTFVSKLREISTDHVKSTAQVTGLVNVFREDEIDKNRMLSQKAALSNAKKTHNGYFVVPSVWT